MLLFAAGVHAVQPRLKFSQLYSKPLTKPLSERRLRITSDTAVRGEPVYSGTVLAFDVALPDYNEDFGLLVGSLKAARVSNDTPLVTVPAPELAQAKRK